MAKKLTPVKKTFSKAGSAPGQKQAFVLTFKKRKDNKIFCHINFTAKSLGQDSYARTSRHNEAHIYIYRRKADGSRGKLLCDHTWDYAANPGYKLLCSHKANFSFELDKDHLDDCKFIVAYRNYRRGSYNGGDPKSTGVKDWTQCGILSAKKSARVKVKYHTGGLNREKIENFPKDTTCIYGGNFTVSSKIPTHPYYDFAGGYDKSKKWKTQVWNTVTQLKIYKKHNVYEQVPVYKKDKDGNYVVDDKGNKVQETKKVTVVDKKTGKKTTKTEGVTEKVIKETYFTEVKVTDLEDGKTYWVGVIKLKDSGKDGKIREIDGNAYKYNVSEKELTLKESSAPAQNATDDADDGEKRDDPDGGGSGGGGGDSEDESIIEIHDEPLGPEGDDNKDTLGIDNADPSQDTDGANDVETYDLIVNTEYLNNLGMEDSETKVSTEPKSAYKTNLVNTTEYDVKAGGTVKNVTKTLHLWACWTPKTFTYHYYKTKDDADRKVFELMSIQQNRKYKTPGLLVPDLNPRDDFSTPEGYKHGYTHVAWRHVYPNTRGYAEHKVGEICQRSADTYCWPVWEGVDTSITFDYGYDDRTTTVDYKYGSSIDLSSYCCTEDSIVVSNTEIRKGYRLVGWSLTKPEREYLPKETTSKNYNYTYKYNGAVEVNWTTAKIKKGITLYAVWEYYTTLYVYTNDAWHLCVPYIYTGYETVVERQAEDENGNPITYRETESHLGWQESMAYAYTKDNWKV